jgi:hypothetical protein
VATVRVPGHDAPLIIRPKDLRNMRLRASGRGDFVLHVEGVRRDGPTWKRMLGPGRDGAHDLTGDDALRAAASVLPRLNRNGASQATVRDAVDLLETARSPEECFALVNEADRRRFSQRSWQFGDPGMLHQLPMAARLALEMAAHEEGERRALEGELADLERAWRDADEIAAIADDLAIPTSVRGAFERLKARVGA